MSDIVQMGYVVTYNEGKNPLFRYLVKVYLDGELVLDIKFKTRRLSHAAYYAVIEQIKRGDGHEIPVSCSS